MTTVSALFAPRPLSTALWESPAVDVFDYVPGSGIAAQPSRTLALAGIDPDGWLRSIAASIDALLTESFFAAVDVVDGIEGTNRRAGVLAQIARLADELTALMIPLQAGPNATVASPAVREAFREALLDRLSNLYTTQAAIAGGSAAAPELLRGPEVVRDATGAVVASVTRVVEGGAAVHVPIALRVHPAPPAIVNQAGAAEPAQASARDLPRWRYLLAYALDVHDPRDAVHGRIAFDVSDDEPRVSDAIPQRANSGSLSGMAEFIMVFPAVADDLQRLLREVGRDTEPDPGSVRDAGIALDALTNLMARIALPALQRIPPMPAAGPVESPGVAWSIVESVGTGGELVVTLEVDRGAGLVIDAFTVFAGQPTVYVPRSLPDPQVANAATLRRRFVYEIDGDPARLLRAAAGQEILERALTIEGLDLFRRRNARASIMVERNGALAEPFVYRTPDVTSVDVVFPERDVDAVFALGDATDSLEGHLTRFFGDLFANAGRALGIGVAVDVAYAYAAPGLPPVVVPVFAQPMLAVAVDAASAATPVAELVAVWRDAIFAWFSALEPPAGGTLRFDLRIASDRPPPSRLVLRLRDARLPLALIEPRPETAVS